MENQKKNYLRKKCFPVHKLFITRWLYCESHWLTRCLLLLAKKFFFPVVFSLQYCINWIWVFFWLVINRFSHHIRSGLFQEKTFFHFWWRKIQLGISLFTLHVYCFFRIFFCTKCSFTNWLCYLLRINQTCQHVTLV